MANNQLEVIRESLNSEKMLLQISTALPESLGVSKERFIRTAMTMISQNPDLVKVDRQSLYGAIMSCAQLGLMPESYLGQAYIIPFKNKAQLQIGYRGLINLARRSGMIESIHSGVAHAKDKVTFVEGTTNEFRIDRHLDGDPGPATLAWCVIKTTDGGEQVEVMSAKQVEDIRLASPSKNSPAWKSSWDQMARKVVIKRALKYAPMSTDTQKAVAVDNAPEEGRVLSLNSEKEVEQIDAPEPEKKKRAPAKRKSRLENLKGAQEVPPEQEPPEPPAGEEPPIEEAPTLESEKQGDDDPVVIDNESGGVL